jgi:hypothetical protein
MLTIQYINKINLLVGRGRLTGGLKVKGCTMRTTTEYKLLDCVDDLADMARMLKECERALNQIVNTKISGEHKTTYDLCVSISDFLTEKGV